MYQTGRVELIWVLHSVSDPHDHSNCESSIMRNFLLRRRVRHKVLVDTTRSRKGTDPLDVCSQLPFINLSGKLWWPWNHLSRNLTCEKYDGYVLLK